MSSRYLHLTALGGLLAGALALSACEPAPGTSAAPSSTSSVGSASFQLTLTGGAQFNQVSYDVSGNGFHRAGTVDVSHSATFSTLVTGIPFGAGYTAALSAQDVAHRLMDCQGSTSFDVTSAATVPVAVHMTCHEVVNPPAVPVPRVAIYALGGLLLAVGVTRVRSSKEA